MKPLEKHQEQRLRHPAAWARIATEVEHVSPPLTDREPVPADPYPDSDDDPDDPVDLVVPTTDAEAATKAMEP